MTSGERVIKNVIEGINRAFQGIEIGPSRVEGTLIVRALERHVPNIGMTMGPQGGFTLTIGDRVAQFSGDGRYLEQGKAKVEYTVVQWQRVKDARPDLYARFCKGEITEEQLFAEETPAETKQQEKVGAKK